MEVVTARLVTLLGAVPEEERPSALSSAIATLVGEVEATLVDKLGILEAVKLSVWQVANSVEVEEREPPPPGMEVG